MSAINTSNMVGAYMGSDQVLALAMGSELIWSSGPAPTPPTPTSAYTVLQYVETDGACWFDTGIIPSMATKIQLNDVAVLSTNYTYNVLIGGCSSDFYEDGISVRRHSSIRLGLRFGDVYSESFSFTANQTYDIEVDKDNFKIDQTTYSVGATEMYSGNTYTMYIGAEHNNQGAFRPVKAKFGEVKIYNGATLVADLVPAEYEGSIGFWDTVANVFRPNLGTGTPTTASA